LIKDRISPSHILTPASPCGDSKLSRRPSPQRTSFRSADLLCCLTVSLLATETPDRIFNRHKLKLVGCFEMALQEWLNSASPLISSHLLSSPLISSHLLSSPLISSPLLSTPPLLLSLCHLSSETVSIVTNDGRNIVVSLSRRGASCPHEMTGNAERI
jgi:hypothetical protein